MELSGGEIYQGADNQGKVATTKYLRDLVDPAQGLHLIVILLAVRQLCEDSAITASPRAPAC